MADQYAEIRQLAAQVAREVYEPMAESLDVTRTPISKEQRLRLGELGFLGITHPEEYGGSGAPLEQALAVIEEFAKVCRPAAFQIFEANTGPAQVITHLASEEQKKRWLPDIVSGERTMAVAISEPDAGSAATDMRTSAKRGRRPPRAQRLQALDLQRWRGRPIPGLLPPLRRAGRQGHRRRRRGRRHPRLQPTVRASGSWASAASPRPTSTSTTSRCRWRTSWSRPAPSVDSSASSPSSAWATPR